MGIESVDKAAYARKLRKAAQLLFLQRHKRPGAKGWELKRAFGKRYTKVLDLLSGELEKLGLQIKTFSEGGVEPQTEEQKDKTTFFVTLKEPVGTLRATAGFRIDDIAMLAAVVAYITSKHGKVQRKEVEQILAGKFPRWRIEFNLQRFIRRGYLKEDPEGVLHLDWRSLVEIDQKSLLTLMLGME